MEYYLTQERLDELKQELEDLKTNQRIEVADRLKRAKELGDLSENSEYADARDEYNQIETRIMELETMIKNASIIKKSEATAQVEIGSTIEVSKGRETKKFTIVGSNEARPEAGLISNESPLGKSFLGKKTGDSVTVTVPAGEITYKILGIE